MKLEFTVTGTPVSHQTKRKSKRRQWQQDVRDAAKKRWKKLPSDDRIRITVVYFHEGSSALIDDDNMVKPIRDALNGLVYHDDRQITDTVIRTTPIRREIRVFGFSIALLRALSKAAPFVYIKVESAPDHVEFPK